MYDLQFPIVHAKLMIMGLWLTLYVATGLAPKFVISREGIILIKLDDFEQFFYVLIDGLFLLIYSFYMEKGVSDFFCY